MTKHDCTEERFLKDVKDHTLTVVRNDGVHRHLKFNRGGSSYYGFELITWPGCLCISGDCGTYVFRRVADMFQFFRTSDNDFNKNRDGGLSINPDYWGEKLESIGTNAGYRAFDVEAFVERVTEHFDNYWEAESDTSDKEECWEELQSYVIDGSELDEHAAYAAVNDFSYGGFSFEDFFDGDNTEKFTFRYIWCLYAIAWGVEKFDEYMKIAEEIK